MIGGMTGLASAGVEAYGKGQKGAFSSGYQDYLEGLPEGTRPMSFTAFQADQKNKQYQQGLTSAKGNLPASGYGRQYGES
jgi:hypothetical protein